MSRIQILDMNKVIFKRFISFIFIICMWVGGGVCAHECGYPGRPGEDSLSPGVGASKPFKVAVGSLSQVLCAFSHPVTELLSCTHSCTVLVSNLEAYLKPVTVCKVAFF